MNYRNIDITPGQIWIWQAEKFQCKVIVDNQFGVCTVLDPGTSHFNNGSIVNLGFSNPEHKYTLVKKKCKECK